MYKFSVMMHNASILFCINTLLVTNTVQPPFPAMLIHWRTIHIFVIKFLLHISHIFALSKLQLYKH